MFVFDLGFLTVVGPAPTNLDCVRGRKCTSLSIAGVGLLDDDNIRIQDVCGGSALQITTDNILGNAVDVVSDLGDYLTFGFGAQVVSIRPRDAYDLCWCSIQHSQGIQCERDEEFLVRASSLKIE